MVLLIAPENSEKQNVKLLLWGSETVINCLMRTDGFSRKLNEEKITEEERFTLSQFLRGELSSIRNVI